MKTEIILEVNKLEKSFMGQNVIQDFSLVIRRGERVALCAPSGAGKTTLLRIIAGLEKLDAGSVRLEERSTAVVFQEPRLFPFMTVEENIFLPFHVGNRKTDPTVYNRFQEWMDVCELAGYEKHYPWQLSGGMKQKTALVRALLGCPAFLLMDEPFQSIGSQNKQEIIQYLLANHPEITVLFITHNQEEVPMLAHRVVYFQQTRLSQALHLSAACFHTTLSY